MLRALHAGGGGAALRQLAASELAIGGPQAKERARYARHARNRSFAVKRWKMLACSSLRLQESTGAGAGAGSAGGGGDGDNDP